MHTRTITDVANVTTSGTEMIVAHGWAHATTSATMLVLAQLHQIVTAVLPTPLKMLMAHAYVMKDTVEKAVPSG